MAAIAPALAGPPDTNRGVYPPNQPSPFAGSMETLEHLFDYYRASVPANRELIVSVLEEGFTRHGVEVRRADGPKVRYYASNMALIDGQGRIVVQVLSGGQNITPNVVASGYTSRIVADILRDNWSHSPSRIDVKCDVVAEGLYHRLIGMAKEHSAKWNLRPPREYNNNHPDLGDTIYLGSRQSPFFLRIYQKGLQIAQSEGRYGDQITADERNAVRFELEFKPQKPRAKGIAATIQPADIWGLCPWVADFAREVFAMNVQPISIAERRESNRARALRFMGSQYRKHLAELLDECQGDLAAFGAEILNYANIDAPVDKCITS